MHDQRAALQVAPRHTVEPGVLGDGGYPRARHPLLQESGYDTAGHPAMQYVAYDGDASILEPVEAAQRLREGVEVEESLGRVLAAAVAGVDHRRRGVAGGEGGRSRGLMTKHDRIGPEAVEGDHGIDEGLAFGDGRTF